jgi:signal transduction histidine kinase
VTVSLRVRLTALYGGIFVLLAALLLGISWWLVAKHLERTLPFGQADAALAELGGQYLLALGGASLLATALGWALAGRELASMNDAFDAQARFVANASHELRSPLTVIRTEADVALADPDASIGELREMGAGVLEATDRLDALLDGLMELARGRNEIARRERVDLAAVARAASSDLQAERVALRWDLAPARVRGDARLLERLAGNLIENGVRYNRSGGHVAVNTAEEDGRAVLRVSNTGPLLDPGDVVRLLEPFERGARARDGGGSGLGLSIVRSIAEAHGGRVELTARPAGGLDVEVALPRA